MVGLVRSRPDHDPSTWLPFPDIGYAMHANPWNAASRRVMEKLGMEYRGTYNLKNTPYAPAVIWAQPGLKDLKEYGFDKFIEEEAKS
ncbi:hypothetical protein CPB85DRAFT_1293591 [Mucidula mucida]|nr:hypothetical protein CPB85DRAFT_1293591 [Mucidula mucida]